MVHKTWRRWIDARVELLKHRESGRLLIQIANVDPELAPEVETYRLRYQEIEREIIAALEGLNALSFDTRDYARLAQAGDERRAK